MKRRFKTGDSLWKQAYEEQHGEDKDIEHHRGLIELMKNHRDAYLTKSGRIARDREIHFIVKGNTIETWNRGYPWVHINDFEIVGKDSEADKGSRNGMEDSISGKELGRLQIFRLARLNSDDTRDFEVVFHCKNIDGKEASVRIYNWNETDGTYEVEILNGKVEGTTWTIRCNRNIDIVEMQEYLDEQLRFFDTDIHYNFNGNERTHRAPSKSERGDKVKCRKKLALPKGLGTAYINYWGNGDFKVYNLGIKLRTPLDIGVSGISGTIITDKFLAEDLGRGSLIQSDEFVDEIITDLKHFAIENLTNKIKNKSGADLTHSEREFLLKRARWDGDLRRHIETKLIIPRGNGSYTSIARVVKSVNDGNDLFWATGNNITNDKAVINGFNVVDHSSAVEEILGKYGVEGCALESVETVRQWENGYKLLNNDPETEQFFDEVLKEWLILGMRSGIQSQETPEMRIGTVDGNILAWTNSSEYIAFRKDLLIDDMRKYYKLDTDLQRLEFLRHSETLSNLTHEIAHWAVGEDSIKISTHGADFEDAQMKVRFVVYQEMDKRIKDLLREQEPRLAEWTTKVKYRKGGDGKLIFAIAIPREEAEKLELNENSLVHTVLKTATEMDDNYSKRGYSHKTNGDDEEE